VPGNGLHVSGEPETPLQTSHRDDQAAMSRKDHTALGNPAKVWSEVFVSFSAVTISILARTAAGKLPATGVETQMPVSPLQVQIDYSAGKAPARALDSCSVGESKPTAYVRVLVEGVGVTVLIDSGSNVSLISEDFRMSMSALLFHAQ